MISNQNIPKTKFSFKCGMKNGPLPRKNGENHSFRYQSLSTNNYLLAKYVQKCF